MVLRFAFAFAILSFAMPARAEEAPLEKPWTIGLNLDAGGCDLINGFVDSPHTGPALGLSLRVSYELLPNVALAYQNSIFGGYATGVSRHSGIADFNTFLIAVSPISP